MAGEVLSVIPQGVRQSQTHTENFQLGGSFCSSLTCSPPPTPIFSGALPCMWTRKKAQMSGCKISTGLWLQDDTRGLGMRRFVAPCCQLLLNYRKAIALRYTSQIQSFAEISLTLVRVSDDSLGVSNDNFLVSKNSTYFYFIALIRISQY